VSIKISKGVLPVLLALLTSITRAETGRSVIHCEVTGNTSVPGKGCRVCVITATGTVCDKDEGFQSTGRTPVAPIRAVVTGVFLNQPPRPFNLDGFNLSVSHNKRSIDVATQAGGGPLIYATEQNPSRHFNGQRVESDGGRWGTSILPLKQNFLSGWFLFYDYTITWDTSAELTEPGVPSDYDGDGLADILWTNSSGGVAIWKMNGTQLVHSSIIQTAAVTGWRIAAEGDFNGDGFTDILWTTSSGGVAIWMMEGDRIIENHVIQQSAVPGWSIAQVGDFNGDRRSDILWTSNSGGVAIWMMNGGSIIQNNVIQEAGIGGRAVDTGDFNGDGRSDILWQKWDGTVEIWMMNGPNIIKSTVLGVIAPTWRIAGLGDFNGDGRSDILWARSNGTATIGMISDGVIIGTFPIQQPIFPGSTIVKVADFNGDGRADILSATSYGLASIWLMSGEKIAAGGTIQNPAGADWQIPRGTQ